MIGIDLDDRIYELIDNRTTCLRWFQECTLLTVLKVPKFEF